VLKSHFCPTVPFSITLSSYRGADKSLARPGREKKLVFLSEWLEFPSASHLAREEP